MGQISAKETALSSELPEFDCIPELKDVTLNDVVPLNDELGYGAYGTVFSVQHGGIVRAAKKIHPILVDGVGEEAKQAIKNDFIRECLCCSSILHPNIVQFLGVYFEPAQSSLPIMVMELMHTSLTKFLDNNKSNISFGVKISIIHDASLGLCFLHNHKPKILHRDLSPNNIMLTNHLVAKIGDLGVAKVIQAGSRETISKLKLTRVAPGTPDFMPPEALEVDSVYGTSIDVFSFGGIALYVFSEEWPTPTALKQKDLTTKKMITLTEVKRRQQYLDKITGKAAELRKMIEQCLDDDPDERPLIQKVSTNIESFKESLPFAQALESQQFHIKWISCSDLPHKLYAASVAVSVAGDRVYAIAGSAPDNLIKNNVYYYNTNTDHWTVLPQPGHRFGVLGMLDDKLTIFGGQDPLTNKVLSKVTTYNSDTNSWYSEYPDMINKRLKLGVITHNNYVVVMGGISNASTILDSLEIMDYHRHHQKQWKEISVHLPIPMWAVKPTISGNSITIVGYNHAGGSRNNGYYQIKVEEILSPLDRCLSTGAKSNQWINLSPAQHWDTATVPYTNPPVIIGGNVNYIPTCDINLYDASKNTWRKVDSLTSARSEIGVASLNTTTIIVIGGTSGGKGLEANKASSLAKVEIGYIVPNYIQNSS